MAKLQGEFFRSLIMGLYGVVWRFGCRRSLLWGSSFVEWAYSGNYSGREIFMCVEFDFMFSSFHVIAFI